MAHPASQQVGSQKWLLVIPAALAVFAVGVGLDNLWGAGENTLRDVLGSPLGAGIAGGFLPAVLLVMGLAWSWRSPGTGVAVTLGLMFLYFALLMAWVGLRGRWVAEGLLSLVGPPAADG